MAKKLKNKINWPALSTVLFNVVPDSTFNIGSGITTITPNLVSLLWGMPADSYEANRILYPEKTVVNPHMGLNTIIYNPNTNNRDAVSLDALHVMHDSPIYLELYKQYVESLPQGFEPLMEAANDEFGDEGVTIIEKYLKGLPLSKEEQEAVEPIYDALLRRQFAPDYMRNVPHGYQDKATLPIIPNINMSGDEAIRRYMESYPLKEVTITPENKHEDGGPLHPDWDELSMRDRAAYIRMGVANGYKNIEDIINVYNEFRKGGAKLNPREPYIHEELPALLRDAGLNVRVTSGYRPVGAVGTAGAKSWHPRHGAVDIVPQGDTTFEDIENVLHTHPVVRQYMLSHNLGLLDESGRTPESKETMRRTGATGAHFHIGKDSKPAAAYRLRVGALLSTDGNKVAYFTNPFLPLEQPIEHNNVVVDNTPIIPLPVNEAAILSANPYEEEITYEKTLPEVVVRPEPKIVNPLAVYEDMLALAPALTPIETPTIPSITEKVTALSNARNTFLQNELENSIMRSQLIDDDFSREKLRRDIEDLKFYRNMSAYGGNLFDGTSQPTQQMQMGLKATNGWKPYTLDDILANAARIEQQKLAMEDRLNNVFTLSNDATSVANGRPQNTHLERKAVEGAKAHAAWEKEHPNLTAWSYLPSAAVIGTALAPLGAAGWSGISALGDAAAATSVGQGITNFLAPIATTSYAGATVPQWFDLGLTSGFGAHGVQTAIDEGGVSPMTAVEVVPLGRLTRPMWNAGKETAYNIADRYIFMPHQNSFTRGIGITDAGLQDAITTGVFRGNPRGTEQTAKVFDKMFLKNRNHFRDIIEDTGIPGIESRYQSRTLTKEDFNALKKASEKYESLEGGDTVGKITLKQSIDPLENYATYEDYIKAVSSDIAKTEQMPSRIASGEIVPNTELSEPMWFEDESGRMFLPQGKPFLERFGPNSDYLADGTPLSYWYADGRNPVTQGHAYAKSNYGVRVNNPEDYKPFMHELHLHPSFFRSPKFSDPNVEIFGKGPLGLTVKLDKETLQPVWKKDLSNMFRRGETIRTPQITAENATSITPKLIGMNETPNILLEQESFIPSFLRRNVETTTPITEESILNDLAAAKSYKESPEYQGLVLSFIEETGHPDIPMSIFYNSRKPEIPNIILESKPKGHLGGYRYIDNRLSVDPSLAKADVPFHEGIHWQRVGEIPNVLETSPEYKAWAESFLNKAPEDVQSDLFAAYYNSGQYENLLQQKKAIEDLYKQKVDDVLYEYAVDSELRKPNELAAHTFGTGKALGLKPFQEYPGMQKALEVIEKARKQNSWLWDIKAGTEEEIKKFWKLLTGNYMPSLLIGTSTVGAMSNINNTENEQ